MIEANLAIRKNIIKTLSVQQMIDCAENGNNGCDGGDSCLLLEWLVNNKINIRTEKDYPRSLDGMNQTCHVLLDDATNATIEVYRVREFTCSRSVGKSLDFYFEINFIMSFIWFYVALSGMNI